MLSIPHSAIKVAEAVLLRVMIFAFVFLELQFTRMFVSASAAEFPYMAMWGTILVDATAMIILALLAGEHSVARDTITLNFYALLTHLVYIPCFYYGYQFGEYHNSTIKTLNHLITLRLFYFGSRDLLHHVAIIDHTKRLLLSRRWFLNSYVNALTIGLFLTCAVPLFTLIYLINTDQMRITGIAIILFVFFIAIEYSNKKKLNRELQAARQVMQIKTVSDATRVRVLQRIRKARQEVAQLRAYIKFLYIGGGLIILLLGAQAFSDKRRDAHFGYAAGYVDAKTGKPARSETDIKKLMKCYDSQGEGRPLPPSKECEAAMNFR